MSNKRIILIANISLRTDLSIKQSEDIAEKIPSEYLDEAIKVFKEEGLDSLNLFIKNLMG